MDKSKKGIKVSNIKAAGGSGGSDQKLLIGFKVTKIFSWRNRKVNLGDYQSVDLNAGVEVQFDEAVSINSSEVKNAFDSIRKVIKDEWLEQYKPFRKIKKPANDK